MTVFQKSRWIIHMWPSLLPIFRNWIPFRLMLTKNSTRWIDFETPGTNLKIVTQRSECKYGPHFLQFLKFCVPLREKCPYSELFWSAFSRIRTRITPNNDTFYAVLQFWSILINKGKDCLVSNIYQKFLAKLLQPKIMARKLFWLLQMFTLWKKDFQNLGTEELYGRRRK